MFHVDHGETLSDARIVDTERDVEFRIVSGIGRSNVVAALLSWGGRQIPLETAGVTRTDSASGRQYGLTGFNTFGESATVTRITGVAPYVFTSPEENKLARLLAIEAILFHKFRWVEGEWDVDGVRVISDGREWKASDFGYGHARPSR